MKVYSELQTRQVAFIPSTMDYQQYLTSIVANRKIRKAHVKMIEESFKKFGTAAATIIVIATKCITGKKEYFIADGQHRVTAASRLNMPLNVVIVELINDTKLNLIKYVSELNSKSKQWNTATYLEKFAECGQDNFAYFTELKQTTGLTVSDLCNIFVGSASSIALKEFKEGTINIADVEDSECLLEAVMLVKNLVPNKAFSRRSLYTIFRTAKDYKKMAKAIIRAANSGFTFAENESELLNQFKAIYQTIKKG